MEMDSLALWHRIITHEGTTFKTTGRGSRLGVEFTYTVSRTTGKAGCHYSGQSIPGYGNELWITTLPDGRRKEKSISRSTVDLAYRRTVEAGGIVKGPKALGIPGARSYLYPMLVSFGVIDQITSNGDHV